MYNTGKGISCAFVVVVGGGVCVSVWYCVQASRCHLLAFFNFVSFYDSFDAPSSCINTESVPFFLFVILLCVCINLNYFKLTYSIRGNVSVSSAQWMIGVANVHSSSLIHPFIFIYVHLCMCIKLGWCHAKRTFWKFNLILGFASRFSYFRIWSVQVKIQL